MTQVKTGKRHQKLEATVAGYYSLHVGYFAPYPDFAQRRNTKLKLCAYTERQTYQKLCAYTERQTYQLIEISVQHHLITRDTCTHWYRDMLYRRLETYFYWRFSAPSVLEAIRNRPILQAVTKNRL
jgi:hypothetical protein